MTDIIDRLRTWCHAPNAASAQDLMDEAADEIVRLRSSMAEQQFCKLPVAGSSPAVGSLAVTKHMPKEISAEVSSHPTSDRIYVSSKDASD